VTTFTDPLDGQRKPLNIPPYRRKGVAPPPAQWPPLTSAPNSTLVGPVGADGWEDYFVYGSDGQLHGSGKRKP
jgi:hypothetical protein